MEGMEEGMRLWIAKPVMIIKAEKGGKERRDEISIKNTK